MRDYTYTVWDEPPPTAAERATQALRLRQFMARSRRPVSKVPLVVVLALTVLRSRQGPCQ